MATSSQSSPLPDPGGIQAAVDRYRDLAKYLIAIIAAVAATLVAGTQLSSIGKLSWADDPGRVVAAVVGFALAIAAVVWTVSKALELLRPIEMSLADVLDDDSLRADIEERGAMLSGLESASQLDALFDLGLLNERERQAWQDTVNAVVGRAAYKRATERFERAWRGMLVGSLLGIGGIIAFTWGANPPTPPPSTRAVFRPAPLPVTIVPLPATASPLKGDGP